MLLVAICEESSAAPLGLCHPKLCRQKLNLLVKQHVHEHLSHCVCETLVRQRSLRFWCQRSAQFAEIETPLQLIRYPLFATPADLGNASFCPIQHRVLVGTL